MAHEEGSELDRDLVTGVPGDQEIEIQARDALAWEDRLDCTRIRVSVCNSAAVLSGVVGSTEEKELAESIVWGVRGVTEVSNDLQVTGAARQS